MAKERIKKQRWIPIYAKGCFNDTHVGETLVGSGDPVGSTVEVNLMFLTNDVKKQNSNVYYTITNVEENRALAQLTGYSMVGSSLRRLVRRDQSKIDDSFATITKDNVMVRFKPLLLTRGKTSRSCMTSIRLKAREYLLRTVKKMNYNAMIEELVYGKLQKGMREFLSKVHPLKASEIREMYVEEGDAAAMQAVAEAAASQEKSTPEEQAKAEEPEVVKEAAPQA